MSSDRPTRPGRLTLGEDAGGPRYFLGGEPVHAGTGLELMLEDETWLPGRFETSNHKPFFCFGVKGTEEEASARLPEGAMLRWPA